MRIRQITTRSERLAKRILGRTLAGTGWAFILKVRVQDVLEKEESLSDSEFSLYRSGHFDFVVCRAHEDVPVFAIEFDGFGHDDPEQIDRDIIKNRLCAIAGLPLLRIGMDALDETEEVSVLEWLVGRFVSWQELVETGALEAIPRDLPKEEARLRWLELAFFHHLENPYPGNLVIAHRLFDRFRIASRVSDYEGYQFVKANESRWLAKGVGSSPFVQALESFWLVKEFESSWETAPYRLKVPWTGELPVFEDGRASEFMVSTIEVELLAQGRPDEALLKTAGRSRFAWAHKTRGPSSAPPHPLIPSAEEMRVLGLSSLDLPWLAGVESELAICDALSQVERWAAGNLLAV